jgi:hypothetical protein
MGKITVFVDQPATIKQKNIVCKLQNYPTLVDAINGANQEFLKENYKSHSRFFFVSEFLSRCDPEELNFRPDFAVTLAEEVEDVDWICIERYLETLIFEDFNLVKKYDDDILLKGKELLLTDYVTPAPLQVPPVPQNLDEVQHYIMDCKHIEDRDTMLVQIEKPYCDLPYTVVIKEFSKKGFKSVFTDLFICNSWGVARKDFEFLEQLWRHWYDDQVYDLDEMLRQATKRCFPEENEIPEPEPQVFRRPIENVLKTLQQREEGIQTNDTDPWNHARLLKRKIDDEVLFNKS